MTDSDRDATDGQGSTADQGSDDGNRSGEPVHLWRRWTDGAEVPFHRYCVFDPADIESSDDDRPPVQYIPRGKVRYMLRHTPLFVSLAIVGTLVEAEVLDGAYGITDFLAGSVVGGFVAGAGPLGIVSIVTAVFVGVALVVQFRLLKRVDVLGLDESASLGSLFVYFLIVVLLVGAAFSVYTVTIDGTWNPANADDKSSNVAFTSGIYLLMVLDGYLVYDWILRLENLFSNLHEKQDSIVSDGDAYVSEFRDEFKAALEDSVRIPVLGWGFPTAYVFSLVFVGPFFFSGMFVGDPSTLTWPIRITLPFTFTYLVQAAFDFILVIVFFQFLVTVTYFHRLLVRYRPSEDGAKDGGDGFVLTFEEGHPDGYAGFKDIGRFATRVNTMIFLGGVYVVYRAYVGGWNAPPLSHSGVAGLTKLTPETFIWLFQFIGPMVVYVLALAVWLRYSFWEIHRTMARGKAARMRDFDENEADEATVKYEKLRSAPVWPINTRVFMGMVSVDLLPIIGLIPFIPT